MDAIAAERTPEHARKALTALRVALRLAERYGELVANPCAGVRVPVSAEGEKPPRILTPEEAARHRRRRRRRRRPPRTQLRRARSLALAFGSGARLGELLALPWGADGLDLEASVLRVRRSVDRVRGEDGLYPFVPPKSRDLAPDDSARARGRRPRCAATASRRGARPTGRSSSPTREGEALSPLPAERAFKRAAKAAGIADPLPRFHDARHAFASHALAAGLSAHAVAALLGHTDAGLVWRRYGHALPDEVAGAGEALAAFRAVRESSEDKLTCARMSADEIAELRKQHAALREQAQELAEAARAFHVRRVPAEDVSPEQSEADYERLMAALAPFPPSR